MAMRNPAFVRKHLDARFKRLSPLDTFAKPPGGWIRSIRQGLGMTTSQLADRMRLSQPRVTAIEQSEAEGAINLKTLERAAAALNCTFVYAFVPNETLDEMVRKRALGVAADRLGVAEQTMRLENQGVPRDDSQLRDMAADLIRRAPRSLWNKQ
jgi:predicted DNA-binding mobile mystery protein A